MSGYQRLVIVGNLGNKPEQRVTADGTPVTSFSLACNRTWTDANGQKQERVTWYRVSAWRRLAEVCAQFLEKGSSVLVEADVIEARAYSTKDGEWRASLEVTAREVKFLSVRGESQESEPAESEAKSTDFGEEIPFK